MHPFGCRKKPEVPNCCKCCHSHIWSMSRSSRHYIFAYDDGVCVSPHSLCSNDTFLQSNIHFTWKTKPAATAQKGMTYYDYSVWLARPWCFIILFILYWKLVSCAEGKKNRKRKKKVINMSGESLKPLHNASEREKVGNITASGNDEPQNDLLWYLSTWSGL